MVRDPEWEGVIDGEVCGIGALAESVRSFLHWVPIKLETREALRLCVSCGDALAREVIHCSMVVTVLVLVLVLLLLVVLVVTIDLAYRCDLDGDANNFRMRGQRYFFFLPLRRSHASESLYSEDNCTGRTFLVPD